MTTKTTANDTTRTANATANATATSTAARPKAPTSKPPAAAAKTAAPAALASRFCWFEINTRDAARAQAFYGELLGWKVQAMPMGATSYEMIDAGGETIGGYVALDAKDPRAPHWTSYLGVTDVDAALASAVAAGARVTAPAFDVPGVGRMAGVVDPQGAAFMLFTGAQPDVEPAPAPGRWSWNELWTSDASAALAFYEKAFGFTHVAMPLGGGVTYYVLKQGDTNRAGLMTSAVPMPPIWVPYAHVADCDAAVARAQRLGGQVLAPPTTIDGVGRFAALADPQGALFAILQPGTVFPS